MGLLDDIVMFHFERYRNLFKVIQQFVDDIVHFQDMYIWLCAIRLWIFFLSSSFLKTIASLYVKLALAKFQVDHLPSKFVVGAGLYDSAVVLVSYFIFWFTLGGNPLILKILEIFLSTTYIPFLLGPNG